MKTSTPRGRVAIIIALALAGSGLAALGASPAIASQVSCGDTITTDTTLTTDLTDCPGDGLVIGADNITLDLRGHTIDGTVTQITDCNASPFGVAGINNAGGYDGLTIKHGTLQQFFSGFNAGSGATGMANSRLLDLTARDNRFSGISMGSGQRLNNDNRILRNDAYGNGCGAGIGLNNAHGNHVADNRVHDNGSTGIAVCCSDSNVVEDNAVFDNKDIGIGVFFGNDSHNVIRHNRVSGNDVGILVSLQEGEQRNVVDANAVSGNVGPGILLDEANANEVRANRVARNGDGIVVFGDRNRIAGNDVAGAVGCPDGCGTGISLEGGQANLIVHNTIAHTLLDGIRVAAFEPDVPTADSVVRDNLVRDAGVDGLSVGIAGDPTVTPTGTLLERNLALGSGDDGIDVESPLTTLTRNLALHNADLGIEAVAGVTDGGRNRARGNGNRAQCSVVITCS